MRRRYRIRMNGNGEFLVERRGIFRWKVYDLQYKAWVYRRMDGGWYGTVFPTSEAACQALLKAQEADAREERAKRWSTVVEERR